MNCCSLKCLDRSQSAFYHCWKLLGQEVRVIVEAKGNSYVMLEGVLEGVRLVLHDHSRLFQSNRI